MYSLQDTCDLDITFDTHDNTIHYGEGIHPKLTNKVSLKNLIPNLLNKSLLYPEYVYEEHQQVFHEADAQLAQQGLSFDLITLPAGLLGIEFIKTHVYYTPECEKNQFSSMVEVHFGILTVIMQKNAPKGEFDFDSSVEDGVMVKLAKGEKLAIPIGYYYTFVNTEDQPVVFVRVYKQKENQDYAFLKKENGLAYYCIRKNAKQEIVHNPLYRHIPHIREAGPVEFLHDWELRMELALYSQMRSNHLRFLEALW